ncbi:UNVERIFIED_CONTAM: hypothetical protein Slati_2372200 [Sesamum latifolium]|uniref:Sialate O-acetylesterase domain-containing protein n=1 Tax=Sesamum latifolium TaxID=2727402 RepID=A0AAW2WBA5_9LAMI
MIYRFRCVLFPGTVHSILSKYASNNNASQGKSIFILAGQSNMAGRGSSPAWMDMFLLNAIKSKSPPAQMRKKMGRGSTAAPPDIDYLKLRDTRAGIREFNSSEEPEHWEIGLVPCAIGGTQKEVEACVPLYNQLIKGSCRMQGGGKFGLFYGTR